jgi:hypothetical protein
MQPPSALQVSVVHGLKSALHGVPGCMRASARHWPLVQESPSVQSLPSSHDEPSGTLTCWQVPAPSHVSVVQSLESVSQSWPAGSNVHVDEQQSPSLVLASSQSSPGSSWSLPHSD